MRIIWTRLRAGRLRLVAAIAAVAALGVAIPVFANLPGSTFESGDGNLAVNTAGNHDWNNPVEAITCPSTPPGAGTNCGTDLTKSGSDDAFGQGAKEDIPNPSEVTGSIPPNKSDLTRFYVNKEKVGSPAHDFLYLAWERSNVLGSANMDFEFNQNATTPAGKHTPLRTAGDILITFDFTNGGGNPVLGLLTWVTSGPTSQCFSSNSLPCWGNREDLSGAGFAEGAVNTTTVHDDNPPPAGGADLPGLTFGEAGIDLTAAGVFPQSQCVHFGSAFLKSRSSASFPAELKDFIAPIPVNIANCGALTVQKYIDVNEDGNQDSGEASLTSDTPPGSVLPGDLAGWSFTVTGPNSFSCTGTTDAHGNLTGCDLSALPAGSYTVQENANASKTIGSNSSPFFNLDPGSDGIDGGTTAASPPVHETVTVGIGGTSNADFGNSCYATANFEVTGVPDGQSGLFVRYSVNGVPAASDVTLVKQADGSTWRGSAGGLRKGDVITWSWGINNDDSHLVTVFDPFTLQGYPSCAGSGSDKFTPSTITGTKYKDINGNGTRDAGEGGLQGFSFQLKTGSTVVDTQQSDATGTYKFDNVAPGSYTIHEVAPTGWKQTQPASGDVDVSVSLGSDATADPFGDTPLSNIKVTFNPEAKLQDGSGTDATKATSISCSDTNGDDVGSSTDSNTNTTDDIEIKQSQVTCVITYTDP